MDEKTVRNRLVKGVEEEIWRKFVGYCRMEGVTVGPALSKILKEHLKGKRVI